ncbi:TPR repeat-containing protein 08 [Orientia tsutsugamushi]|uniref:TPR repeat-containing protein 08 n=1 Tax=Orientia tsutsugamushi TaxID=784 RepID=A0A2U3QS58_ORITS|nr:tetratricopeptide repeat protein [Orientia tsutsugamushi]KJV71953.1 tetratricopeptide repeat family protein [Orientia tsutsugamushi str. UT76]KJV86301.1 tetratricopeptide repeat family protein [Orientia tsutsugamushi str. UT76]SPR03791.1 TPR repeat-containing protein 08 [Orientia tsutsugamushi]
MLTDKYFSKGNSFFQLRKYQEAIKKFNLAIKCNPDSAEAYINKGIALDKLGQHQEAIENYDIAIKYKPGLIAPYIRDILKKVEMQ